jgi:hypothetical protein
MEELFECIRIKRFVLLVLARLRPLAHDLVDGIQRIYDGVVLKCGKAAKAPGG